MSNISALASLFEWSWQIQMAESPDCSPMQSNFHSQFQMLEQLLLWPLWISASSCSSNWLETLGNFRMQWHVGQSPCGSSSSTAESKTGLICAFFSLASLTTAMLQWLRAMALQLSESIQRAVKAEEQVCVGSLHQRTTGLNIWDKMEAHACRGSSVDRLMERPRAKKVGKGLRW